MTSVVDKVEVLTSAAFLPFNAKIRLSRDGIEVGRIVFVGVVVIVEA